MAGTARVTSAGAYVEQRGTGGVAVTSAGDYVELQGTGGVAATAAGAYVELQGGIEAGAAATTAGAYVELLYTPVEEETGQPMMLRGINVPGLRQWQPGRR